MATTTTTTRNGNGHARPRQHAQAVQAIASMIADIEALEGTLTPDVADTGTRIEQAIQGILDLYPRDFPLDSPEGRAALRTALLWDYERETAR